MNQFTLIDLEPEWAKHWRGMPEFIQEDQMPWRTLPVHFSSLADLKAFSQLVGQKLTPDTKSIWFPEAEIGTYANKRYISES